MSIYEETIEELKRNDLVTELYRFQGARSFECFGLTRDKFLEVPNTDYVYFSKSQDHHKSFIVKRTRQLINNVVLKESPYSIASNNICESSRYNGIKSLIIRSEKLPILSSIKLVTDQEYTKLLKSNSVNPHKKISSDFVERVDRRVYGGGYGVDKEWKDLLTYLTYFASIQKIDRKDILKILSNIQQTGRINRKDNVDFIVTRPYNIVKMNPALESDFTKYKIMQALEQILDKGIYLPNSELGLYPTQTIKKITTRYEKNRELILKKFSEHEKM